MPLQALLMRIQSNLDYLAKSTGMAAQVQGGLAALPNETARMAIVVVTHYQLPLHPFSNDISWWLDNWRCQRIIRI